MKKKAKPAPVSMSTLRRLKRQWLKQLKVRDEAVSFAQKQQGEAERGRHALEVRLRDLSALYQTGEAYYRAQRIIATLLDETDASISARLKGEILAALYHGVQPRRISVGEARSHGRNIDVGAPEQDLTTRIRPMRFDHE